MGRHQESHADDALQLILLESHFVQVKLCDGAMLMCPVPSNTVTNSLDSLASVTIEGNPHEGSSGSMGRTVSTAGGGCQEVESGIQGNQAIQ